MFEYVLCKYYLYIMFISELFSSLKHYAWRYINYLSQLAMWRFISTFSTNIWYLIKNNFIMIPWNGKQLIS